MATVAPGTMAPVLSRTVPVSDELNGVCAAMEVLDADAATTTMKTNRTRGRIIIQFSKHE
jgi:hypothetical protein